jgi:hypothetical protein|nr:MAG TPA: hypothetical protein [Caudoviricetes sp.]
MIHYLFPKLYSLILHRHINISYEAARRLIDTYLDHQEAIARQWWHIN